MSSQNGTESLSFADLSTGEQIFRCFIFGYVILCLLFCLFGPPLFFYFNAKTHRKRKEKSRKLGPITEYPMDPAWLSDKLSQKSQPFIKFQTRPFKKLDSDQECGNHVRWAQEQANRFWNVVLPEDTCTVSVPMKNFKCGSRPSAFEPVSGVLPGSTYTYQMFGEAQIQVTTYHEAGVSYIAGYCIFIWHPHSNQYFDSSVITDCLNGTKYPDPKEGTVVLKSNELELCDWNLQQVSKSFKMYHCRSKNKPLMIGVDSGEVKHFEWMGAFGIYEITECQTCRVENHEEQDTFPPSYSTLHVCEC